MADDINMSADQDEINEEEMSTEELDALFDQDESEYEEEQPDINEDDEDSDDEEELDDDEEDEEPGDEDDSESEEDEEESDDDDDEEADDEEDEDPLAEIKAQAEALRKQGDEDAAQAAAEAARAEKMSTVKDDVLKEIFGQKTVKIGDKEVNLEELGAEYGEEIDTLITARSYQMAETMVAKAMEAQGFASNEDLQSIKAENAEFRLMSEVAQDHPDVFKLKNDDKFWNWVDTQGEDVSTLMGAGAKGVSTVISAYKKTSITSKNEKIDKGASKKIEKHKSLHKSTMRSKKGSKSKGRKDGQMSEAEAAAEFDKIEVTD